MVLSTGSQWTGVDLIVPEIALTKTEFWYIISYFVIETERGRETSCMLPYKVLNKACNIIHFEKKIRVKVKI